MPMRASAASRGTRMFVRGAESCDAAKGYRKCVDFPLVFFADDDGPLLFDDGDCGPCPGFTLPEVGGGDPPAGGGGLVEWPDPGAGAWPKGIFFTAAIVSFLMSFGSG